jgi:hypothetical protein
MTRAAHDARRGKDDDDANANAPRVIVR